MSLQYNGGMLLNLSRYYSYLCLGVGRSMPNTSVIVQMVHRFHLYSFYNLINHSKLCNTSQHSHRWQWLACKVQEQKPFICTQRPVEQFGVQCLAQRHWWTTTLSPEPQPPRTRHTNTSTLYLPWFLCLQALLWFLAHPSDLHHPADLGHPAAAQ